jgi:hypothetical protein
MLWDDVIIYAMASTIENSTAPSLGNRTLFAQHDTSGQVDGLLWRYLSGWSSLHIAITVLLILITYDQCTSLKVFGNGHRLLISF